MSFLSADFVRALAQGDDEIIAKQARALARDLKLKFGDSYSFAVESLGSAARAPRQEKLAREIIIPAFMAAYDGSMCDSNKIIPWALQLLYIGCEPQFKDIAASEIIPALERVVTDHNNDTYYEGYMGGLINSIKKAHGLDAVAQPAPLAA